MKKFRAGTFVNQGYYKAFIPNKIYRQWQVEDMEIIKLLSRADYLLGMLDTYSNRVNINRYLDMHIAKEATQSSRIEGTQTNMEEAFMKKEDVSSEKRDDWEELQNYIQAMNEAVRLLDKLPFSSRLIKSTHRTLLQGVRGEHKSPGEYRLSQNWLGGATINDAKFVPPPCTAIGDLMSDLEKFANDDDIQLPDLLKIALIHYQFETIHPFLDGNGRVGRLLITLYLVSKGLLGKPTLYLSDFFERNRDRYYEHLTLVREQGDINQWLKFFLTGVIETAGKGVDTVKAISQLKEDVDKRLITLGRRSMDAGRIVERLYDNPIINATEVEQLTGKSKVTSYKLIADLERLGILKPVTGKSRNKLYAFREYIDLF
ncbi:MAG: Fic family protein [Tannerellaceae bacterium]|jgi:Fic family protein|nr:Fic family protein [Tannerellaceae bacterium]